MIRVLLTRVASLFRSKRLDAELDEEFRAHIALAQEEHMQRGMTPHQADPILVQPVNLRCNAQDGPPMRSNTSLAQPA